ncbi:MAG: hypothetical protein D6678_03725 [Zetaproteobacteria bacterium]|nr:MAG: hypothetical protein D6678_03725 [Zetaproteobacteria bacterium]
MFGEPAHGGGVEAAARAWGCAPAAVLDLSTGLHPEGPPPWLGDWLRANAHLAGRYADVDGEPARGALAEAFGVAPDCVLIGAGAQAFIEVIVQAMGWRSLAIETPCYTEPLRCAARVGCALRPYRRGERASLAEAHWVTSPHNPDGARRAPPVGPGVLDESYMPFAERCRVGVLPDVIRIGSLTKLFCVPGLRLGYAVAEPGLIEILRRQLPPWGAPTPALHLLPRLLPEAAMRDAQWRKAGVRLRRLLREMDWTCRDGVAGFVLARPPGATPDFASARILVRRFPEWPELAGWLRLAPPGDAHGWRRLRAVLCAATQRVA